MSRPIRDRAEGNHAASLVSAATSTLAWRQSARSCAPPRWPRTRASSFVHASSTPEVAQVASATAWHTPWWINCVTEQTGTALVPVAPRCRGQAITDRQPAAALQPGQISGAPAADAKKPGPSRGGWKHAAVHPLRKATWLRTFASTPGHRGSLARSGDFALDLVALVPGAAAGRRVDEQEVP
jgi:hypothetical protein